MHIKDRRSS